METMFSNVLPNYFNAIFSELDILFPKQERRIPAEHKKSVRYGSHIFKQYLITEL